jgi:hypothetical protein
LGKKNNKGNKDKNKKENKKININKHHHQMDFLQMQSPHKKISSPLKKYNNLHKNLKYNYSYKNQVKNNQNNN